MRDSDKFGVNNSPSPSPQSTIKQPTSQDTGRRKDCELSLKKELDEIDLLEQEANQEITNLIEQIQILVQRRDPLIKSILSPKLLIRGLTELKNLVEMINIKKSIVKQVKFLIANQVRKQSQQLQSSKFEEHMLHSIIFGNPGCGKSSCCQILAKIWMSLGFIKTCRPIKPVTNPAATNPTATNPTASTGCQVNSEALSSNFHLPTFSYPASRLGQQLPTQKILETIRSAASTKPVNSATDPNFNITTATSPTTVHKQLNKIIQTSIECNRLVGTTRQTVYNLKNKVPTAELIEITNAMNNLKLHLENIIRVAEMPTPQLPYSPDDNTNSSALSRARSLNLPSLSVLNQSSNLMPTTTSATTSTNLEIYDDPYEFEDPKFVTANRGDLVAEYLGQTAIKTKKVLESARGGVLFVDEAYSLCVADDGSKDKYGEECLTTINEFMSLYPDEIIVIFAGYRDKIMNNIFVVQPGLRRRFTWVFEIEDYSPGGLAKIFTQQLAKNHWQLADDIDLKQILTEHRKSIMDGGGSTEKLAFFCKLQYGHHKFAESISSTDQHNLHNSIITQEMLIEAIKQLGTTDKKPEEFLSHHMYS